MYEIPSHIRSAIRRYEPVEVGGLTLYPIRVKEYEAFQAASPAIGFMQQTLPVDLLSVPLLDAYYKMDIRAMTSGTEVTNLFYRAVLFLALALRVGEYMSDRERVSRFHPVVDKDDPMRLKCLRVSVNGEETHDITPVQFQRLRPILAAQNGIEMISENANPELVEAERDMAHNGAPEMRIDVDDQISFVAALSHIEETEIDEWPILKMKKRERTWTHLMRYLICGTAEAQGTKWKHGNPYPHPYYERADATFGPLKNLSDVSPDAAQKAVMNPGQKIS